MADLTSDPNDRYYLTNCYACKAVAKPDQEYIRNYGGIVCFSCRAFFRRAYQNNTAPKFVCKKSGKCVVTTQNRRKCQKCRLDRCKFAGMSEEAILSEEQKKARFRKMIQKREREQQQHQQQQQQPQHVPQYQDRVEDQLKRRRSDPKTEKIADAIKIKVDQETQTPQPIQTLDISEVLKQLAKVFEKSVQQNPESDIPFLSDVKRDLSTPKPKPQTEKFSQILSSRLKLVVDSYQKTLGTVSCDLVVKMKEIRLGYPTSKISKRDILFFIMKMSEEYKHFAQLQRHFQKFESSDQQLLIGRNTPIFIQLHLVPYLLAPEGNMNMGPFKHQSESSGGLENMSKKLWLKNYHQNLHLENFNNVTKLFKPEADLDEYARLLNKLKFLRHFTSIEKIALLSHILLFDQDSALKLKDSSEAEDVSVQIETLYEKYIKVSEDVLSLIELTSILVKMAVFCSYFMAWDDMGAVVKQNKDNSRVARFATDQSRVACFNIVMPYTEEEERWIGQQFKHVDEAFCSVAVDDGFIHEFLLHSLGVPVSKTFMPNYLSLVMERMWRVLRMHPDFDELPAGAQLQIMNSNCLKGMSLVTVRGEHSSGLQQIQNGFGELAEMKWREYSQKLNLNESDIKSTSIKDSPALNKEQIAEYSQLIADARILICDPTLFKLNLLLAMTQHNSLDDESAFSKLHFKYATLLRRRLWWMHTSGQTSHFKELDNPDAIHVRIRSSIHSLSRISDFLHTVLTSSSWKLPKYLN